LPEADKLAEHKVILHKDVSIDVEKVITDDDVYSEDEFVSRNQ
jgi:hypothetical protein